MSHSRRVLSERNGSWAAKIVFVAEAPGRLGAEITGIPLFGDRTGDRFDELLASMRWARSEVFITNAVLCNPRDAKGNNDSPSKREITNCSAWLAQTLEMIRPELVIALGRVALVALRAIHPHNYELKTSAGKVHRWGSRHLAVLYHPGPRTQVHRPWDLQLEDARAVAQFAFAQLGIRSAMSAVTPRLVSAQLLSCACEFD